jgi:spermidine/putrescine transport system ATP-binding protein
MNHGRIEDEGPPDRVYARPASRFSAGFMGESTLMPSDVAAALPGLPPAPPGGAIAIRPENLRLERQIGLVALGEARVTTVVFQGSYKRVLAVSTARPDLVFIARAEAGTAIAPGDLCMPGCRPDDLIILPR